MTTFSARSATLKVDKGHNPRLTSRGCAAKIVHFWVFFLTQIHFEQQTWLKTVTNLKVSRSWATIKTKPGKPEISYSEQYTRE